MADIIDVILADQRRITRMRQALRDADHYSSENTGSRTLLARVWGRLAFLIEIHADAEEEICHLPMLDGSRRALQYIRNAAADLGDIHSAVEEARVHPPGSPQWWRAVTAALNIHGRHCGRRFGMLTGFLLPPSWPSPRRRSWLLRTGRIATVSASAASADSWPLLNRRDWPHCLARPQFGPSSWQMPWLRGTGRRDGAAERALRLRPPMASCESCGLTCAAHSGRPHRGGDGPVSWPGSPPGPWFLARVLPEARCQGWPKVISGGNAKRP